MFNKPIIVFEGIEGSGKSHHISKVSRYLDKRKIKYIQIREPGGNSNSEKIRKLILDKKSNFDKITDLFLYMAARNENIKTLKKYYHKKVILIDRFLDSTIAYQHYGLGVNINLIKLINKHLLDKIKVNFTFLNVVSQKNLISRLKKRKILNRYDKFNVTFYNKVQKGFLKISKNNKKYMIINSNNSLSINKKKIFDKINMLT